MDFKTDQPIYLQIAAYVGAQLLDKLWQEGERIPSVRELGALLEVNPNTVLRAFERLQSDGIILNKRGLGYFVAEGSLERWKQIQKALFIDELPHFFERMERLDFSEDQFMKQWAAYKEAR